MTDLERRRFRWEFAATMLLAMLFGGYVLYEFGLGVRYLVARALSLRGL